jgi:type I restriction enzyme, S subunit
VAVRGKKRTRFRVMNSGAVLPIARISGEKCGLGGLTMPSRPRRTPREYKHLPFVGMEQVESHTRRLLGTPPSSDMKSTAFHFQPGDVLYGWRRPYVNKVLCVDFEGLCSSEFIVLPPQPSFEPKYLAFYLSTDGLVSFANQLKQGDRPRVHFDQIAERDIPVPPFPEQRRIVAKLEKLLAKVDAGEERLAKIRVLLKRFCQAVLGAACSGRLTEDRREDASPESLLPLEPPSPGEMTDVEEILDAPPSSRWLPLQAACDPDRSICYGVIKLGAETTKGIPCLRTSDVKPLAIDTTGVKRIAVAVSDEYRRTVLRGGEVLVNVRGTLGGVAVVPPAMRGWNVSREVAVVPVQGVLPRSIAFWIASVPCQNWLAGVAKGVAYTGINIAELKLLPVAIPSLAEQAEIIRRVDARFAVADQIQARFERARQQVDKPTPSILARAFRGELVPQDPDDEPAEALLERIGQQKTRSHAKATQV